MEVFSLLKYWKGGGGSSAGRMCASATTATPTTTITASVPREAYETEDSDDEGPFFDLEFTVPTDEDEKEQEAYEEDEEEEGSEETEGDGDIDVRVLSRKTAARQSHVNLHCSSSEDLFFKGGIVPLESSFPDLNPCDPNSGKRQQFPVSLLRSTTKFRVFFLGFKKVKTSDAAVTTPSDHKQQQQQQQQQQSRLFTVKFKVKKVPIISLFSRKNSRRRSPGCKMHQQQVDDDVPASEGGKRPARELVEKYLKMIKPFYIRRVVSRRNAGKEDDSCARDAALSRSKSTSSSSSNSNSNKTQAQIHHSQSLNQNQTSLPTRLRVVCRHLGKSRSAPSSTSAAAVAAAPLPPHLQVQRRDDSLLQQQDGIQGAIAHCKRPFNASSKSKDSELSCGESEKDAYT